MAQESGMCPIAIVGMGCRFSGQVDSPEKLWEMLAEGRNGWSKIPESRFKLDGLYHPDSQRTGATHVQGGNFLDQNIASFDASFFNLPEQVAKTLDPQYRMELEVVYEALESAGIPLEQIMGSDTSVYGGIMFRDYHDLNCRDPDQLPRYFMTGNAATMASNRVSHFYDLRGPSLSVDTGCSTTLTALHLACQGLRAKESSMSIVTGASLMINPDVFISMSSLGFLSADGMSFAFDDRANGYGRGEGVAAIIIKRLDDAVRDGDPIRAIVRDTAINQDGRTATITTPSKDAQVDLIRSCYERVRLDPSQTSYVEAHGTGTPTGDPLEVEAIVTAFRKDGKRNSPLFLGSVKSNIGHTEATSGLASIIKTAIMLEKGQIPPNGNFLSLNKRLTQTLQKANAKIPTSVLPWPQEEHAHRASINNFGFGGANAHAILEQYPNAPNVSTEVKSNGTVHLPSDEHCSTSRLFTFSAKDEKACQRMATHLAEYLRQCKIPDDDTLLANLAYTLGCRRSRLTWSTIIQADSIEELTTKLDSGRSAVTRLPERAPRLGWVFTGQGAQWFAMGRELITAYPAFRDALIECDGYIAEMGSTWSILEELNRSEGDTNVNRVKYSLPLSTAIQIALTNLLWSWGLKATAVVSHSSGEITAAYAAGILDMRAAIGIAYIRGDLTATVKNRTSQQEGMIAVGLSRQDANNYISRVTTGRLVVACVNSQSSVTVSGDLAGITEIEQLLKADDIFARKLHVEEAFHSEHQLPTAGLFGAALKGLLKRNSSVGSTIFCSPKTGNRMLDQFKLSTPSHWVEAMLQPVEFESAFRKMCFEESGKPGASSTIDAIIEVGPHEALKGPIKQIMASPQFEGKEIPYMPCLIRGKNSVDTTSQLVINLTKQGYRVNLDAFNFPRGRYDVKVLHDLPKYPWNHQNKYWIESRINRALRERSVAPHDLVGSRQISSSSSRPQWRRFLRVSDIPWVREHVVQKQIFYPGAGYLVMAIEATAQLFDHQREQIKDYSLKTVDFFKPLVIPDDEVGVEVLITMSPCDEKSLGSKDWYTFEISSVSQANEWTEHCKGFIRVDLNSSSASKHYTNVTNSAVLRKRIDGQDFWSNLHSLGICHGPVFQNFSDIRINRQGAVIRIDGAKTAKEIPRHHQNRQIIHPVTLDSVIQASYAALEAVGSKVDATFVPKSVRAMRISAAISEAAEGELLASSQLDEKRTSTFKTSTSVSALGRKTVINIEGLTFQSLGSTVSTLSELNTCSSWRWAKDISLSSGGQVTEQMKVQVSATEMDIMKDLRRASMHFIRHATEALSIADIKSLSSHHKKYYAWMKEQLKLESKNHFESQCSTWKDANPQETTQLLGRVATDSTNGEMICHLGYRIVEILQHKISPLELMLQNNLLPRYYVDALKWSRANKHAAQLVALCAHKWPQLSILEIGGGTGSCTQAILNQFTEESLSCARYDFTDTSSGFFEPARERFVSWQDVMTLRKLDIEQNPAEQGFEDGTYDVIVACQVLHATKNIDVTLSNVRRLLKPGGKLILVETTRDELDLCLTFGLLPGWWLSEEVQRKWSPSLTLPLWHEFLTNNQFTGIDCEVPDCSDERFYQISTMMSTAAQNSALTSSNSTLISSSASASTDTVIVTNAESTNSAWLAELQRGVVSTFNCKVSIEPLEKVDATDKICIFLGELSKPHLDGTSPDTFELITRMALKCKGLLWASHGATMDCLDPHQSLHLGVLRTLRTEYIGKPYVSLDLDSEQPPWTAAAKDSILKILSSSVVRFDPEVPQDNEFTERSGNILVARATKNVVSMQQPAETAPQMVRFAQRERPLKLDIRIPGLLDTLFFVDDAEAYTELPGDFIEIDAKAFGLNFRDVMVAMGQLNSNAMGFECSGIISRVGMNAFAQGFRPGQRVASLLQNGWCTRPRAHWTSVTKISADVDFVEAASYPLAFATAYVALHEMAHLQKGDKILIHAASGGTGQAAITLAQHVGAEVFVSVGTPAKSQFVSEKFGIPSDHIFSSRNVSFVPELLSKTNGHGVDVVLNSLSGQLLQESFNCLCEFGRFVEIGKRDFEQNSYLEMEAFARGLTFASLDMLKWQKSKSSHIARVMRNIGQLLDEKAVKPISPITKYPISSIEKPFRLMQAGRHMGKVVVTVGDDETVPVAPRPMPFCFKTDASYLVVGGLHGLGSSVCEWMIERGAKHIIVSSRNIKQTEFLQELQSRCNVRAIPCDVGNESQLKELLGACADMPPIKGVIQGAMVLQDVILESMTAADFNAAVRPKVQGSWNLHKQVQDLDFFVMLSSLVGVLGNASQANYAAANTFQDALAAHRKSMGLAAVTIDLGMVKSIGYVAETQGVSERLARFGYKALHEHEVLQILETAISGSSPPQIITGINTEPGSHWKNAGPLAEYRFAGLKTLPSLQKTTSSASNGHASAQVSLRNQLRIASSLPDATQVILRGLAEKFMIMFGLEKEDIDFSKTVVEYGVDSLIAVELRNWIVVQTEANITMSELMQSTSLTQVSSLIASKSNALDSSLKSKVVELVK